MAQDSISPGHSLCGQTIKSGLRCNSAGPRTSMSCGSTRREARPARTLVAHAMARLPAAEGRHRPAGVADRRRRQRLGDRWSGRDGNVCRAGSQTPLPADFDLSPLLCQSARTGPPRWPGPGGSTKADSFPTQPAVTVAPNLPNPGRWTIPSAVPLFKPSKTSTGDSLRTVPLRRERSKSR